MVPKRPAQALGEALETMTWSLEPGSFALAALPELPGPGELAALGTPAQVVLEPGEVSVLAREAAVLDLVRGVPAARVERDLAWIRFDAAMGWEVVGFLARVTGRLAEAGVPLGAVCGYSRDHLFVARPHLERATGVLRDLFGPPSTGPRD